jgi:hypothetical protein
VRLDTKINRGTARGEEDISPRAAPDQATHAAYIRDMVFELRSIAERHDLVVLAYFLDMAHEEASNRARQK